MVTAHGGAPGLLLASSFLSLLGLAAETGGDADCADCVEAASAGVGACAPSLVGADGRSGTGAGNGSAHPSASTRTGPLSRFMASASLSMRRVDRPRR